MDTLDLFGLFGVIVSILKKHKLRLSLWKKVFKNSVLISERKNFLGNNATKTHIVAGASSGLNFLIFRWITLSFF